MSDAVGKEFAATEDSISWAQDATAELEQIIKAFFKRDVAKIIVEIDPETGDNVQKIKFLADIPKSFRRKATEALITSRHSFDQAVFAARNVVSIRSAKGINFPWARNPTDLDRLLGERGIDSGLWDTFRAHQPYATSDAYVGGDDLIRTLATIANDKHTVGLSVNGLIGSTRFPNIHGKVVQNLSILNPVWDSQKNEADLVRWKGNVEIDGDYQFSFHICLKDARLSQPVDVIHALQVFTHKADEVCKSLKTKCLDLTGGIGGAH